MKPKPAYQEFIFRRKAPTYDWARVTLVIASDVTEASEKRGIVAAAQARTVCDNDKILVILPFNANVGLCAHEATHAAVFILDTSGVALTTTVEGQTVTVNDEPLAYLVDNFSEWFAQKLCVVGKKTGVIPEEPNDSKKAAAVPLAVEQPLGESGKA